MLLLVGHDLGLRFPTHLAGACDHFVDTTGQEESLLGDVVMPAGREVLRFRDEAWTTYFSNPAYLSLVESRFGPEERRNVEAMSKIQLRRKILGDPPPEK